MRIRITDKNPPPTWTPEDLARRIVDIYYGRREEAFESPTFHPYPEGTPTNRYQIGGPNNCWLHIDGPGQYTLNFRYSGAMEEEVNVLAAAIRLFAYVDTEVLP